MVLTYGINFPCTESNQCITVLSQKFNKQIGNNAKAYSWFINSWAQSSEVAWMTSVKGHLIMKVLTICKVSLD